VCLSLGQVVWTSQLVVCLYVEMFVIGLLALSRAANLFTVSHVTCIQNKTMLKYTRSDANWLEHVNDVANHSHPTFWTTVYSWMHQSALSQ